MAPVAGSLFVARLVAAALYLAVGHHHVVIPYGPVFEEGHQALADACSVAPLGFERGARDMRGHGVVWHRAPRVVRRGWLGIPDVAGVAAEVSLFEGLDERICLDDSPAGDVDEVRSPLHRKERLPVEEAFRLGC